MQARIVSYSKNGRDTAQRVAELLTDLGWECRRFALPKYGAEGDEPLTESASVWAERGFREAQALVFVCAVGIAVRGIAPWVRDKTTDPAVLVLDEGGRFVIPLLSGHLGGANELAVALAEKLGATPVLTTATDVGGVFAVDVFAKKNKLHIGSMGLAKAVSAALLSGQPVGFRSDLPWTGELPRGLTQGEAELGIWVSAGWGRTPPFRRTMQLTPRRYAAGMGCRKGKSEEELAAFLTRELAACGVDPRELQCLASIDLKKEEPGLLALSQALGVPLVTYSAEALAAVPGEFTASAFVQAASGEDSACERAAVLASGGPLIVKKTAESGMTFALAKYEEGICFE